MRDVNLLINNGVNVKKSLELFGDMATYDETLGDFLSDINEKEAKIKQSKEIGDMANYAILVHGLKSDAKYFGFDKLANLAYQHEMASKENNMYYVTENFDDLIKELDFIVHLVKQYLGLEEVGTATSFVAPKKDRALIVVDDSSVIKNFVQKIFNNQFEVLMASDGTEALNLIASIKDTRIVGMLLDLNMPNFNGFQVLEYFKNNNLFDRIPVSIITGVGNDNLVANAFNYPIVDVIRKPFNERDIKEVVEKTVQYAH
ncbi:MAG TPA: response regulator [Candidatus Onthousia faecavium]|nr:response regulator [Candidatus Onthousia faecavium]